MSDPSPAAGPAPPTPGPALSRRSADGRARAQALEALAAAPRTPTSLVDYESRGSLLIIGPEPYALSMARELRGQVECTVLATGPAAAGAAPQAAATVEGLAVARAPLAALEGHLGAFRATVTSGGAAVDLATALDRGRPHFDLVLDLQRSPALRAELPPPGYYAPRGDEAALHRALAEIPGMRGSFEKPRYFHYDPDICAHGRSGLAGCTRCLEACPTDAIRSLGELVEVDPYLCQGGGGCATACPTGAITYAYPRPEEMLGGVRRALAAYRAAGGTAPWLLWHGAETGRAWLESLAAELPEWVIPLEVEEIGSVGMEAWLSALAYGASGVALLCPADTPASLAAELRRQLGVARALLEGLGYAGARLALVAADAAPAAAAQLGELPREAGLEPAGYAAQNEKRTTLRLAIDHLHARAPRPAASAPLPAGAPFGEVVLDRDACTLCMACVSVCPAAALQAGGETPALRFIEWNCVQCGLCETACPEDAVTLAPRILYDPAQRHATRTLKEEAPFRCVACGKPFATQAMMQRMREKLQGHWMFQKPGALRRLEMCEECRVKDMFVSEGGLTDPYGGQGPTGPG